MRAEAASLGPYETPWGSRDTPRWKGRQAAVIRSSVDETTSPPRSLHSTSNDMLVPMTPE